MSRRWRPAVPAAVFVLAMALTLGSLGGARADLAGAQRPAPRPAAPVEHYDPDPQVCKAPIIRQAFASQMQPWLDQPAAVLAKLRQLQLNMTRASLQRCVSKGLMPEREAEALLKELETATPQAAGGSEKPSTQPP